MREDEVMQMMTDMGLHEGGMDNWVADNAWWKFANLVAQHERERLAKVFDDRNTGTGFYEPHEPAEIIRARGTP